MTRSLTSRVQNISQRLCATGHSNCHHCCLTHVDEPTTLTPQQCGNGLEILLPLIRYSTSRCITTSQTRLPTGTTTYGTGGRALLHRLCRSQPSTGAALRILTEHSPRPSPRSLHSALTPVTSDYDKEQSPRPRTMLGIQKPFRK
jgi:hypothetical protein